MGKNKIRSKDKSRKDKTSISDTNGSSTPSTWTSSHGAVITRSTSNTSDRRQLPTEPPGKTLCVPTITSLKDTTTSSTSPSSSPAPPVIRGKGSKDKRDSVISSTWEGPKQQSEPKATTAARPRWGFRPRNWWPCRIIRWIYQFFVALTRIRWTDKQISKDLILTLAFVGIVVAGGYVALDILLNAIPGVSAQAVDGNCSIVYVTVPGPIITISLVGASPTNPAKGTYYFSVVNSTTEWLDSIAPPSRFSTLPTRTADVTPIVSSVGVTSFLSSGAAVVSSTLGPTTSTLSLSGPFVSSSRAAYSRFYAIHNSVAVCDLYAFKCNHLISRLIKQPAWPEIKHTPKHTWRNIFGASTRLERTNDFKCTCNVDKPVWFHFATLLDVLNREFHFDTGDVADFSSIIRSKQYIQPYIVVELLESAFD
ncbi:hypothetical protein J4E85_003743 [Alternaria conjuncta]|uniref:uncharacterized protein n=1 Tax=Alternaria conjuncta TaxID=181017 RepID=UPI00221F8C15|nr:uncharacterized protein J4E85_003743 [Alternaria conjuncta]KAI4931154.1 hypothetical protein J4E85_003743 [Alternaria conjuncta]